MIRMDLREEIQKSGLFDQDWYLKTYPDVALSGVNPLDHFILVGLKIDRNPGPLFDIDYYLEQAPEATQSDLPPLLHFIRIGRKQGKMGYLPPSVISARGYTFDIEELHVRDFRLSVSGWVSDDLRPGLAVRLTLNVGGQVRQETLAYALPPADHPKAVQRGFLRFQMTIEVSEKDLSCPIDLAVVGASASISLSERISTDPAPKDEVRAQGVKPIGTDEIIGNVEAVGRDMISGWAACKNKPMADDIDLILFINGHPYSHVKPTIPRPDVQKLYGGNGYCGFHFELAPNLLAAGPVEAQILPATGANSIKKSTFTIFPTSKSVEPAQSTVSREFASEPDRPPFDGISLIILNRNGEEILRDMFESAERVGDLFAFEWIIVDHQSTDGSRALCDHMKDRGVRVSFIFRNGNFSFSESNNLGASLASGELLLFANNDLIFDRPVAKLISERMRDSRIGVLGARLTDFVDSDDWRDREVIQHVGVFFTPYLQGGWLRPYESRCTEETAGDSDKVVSVPAVTGAFMAMWRDDFTKVGGFSEEYSYGLEDIDLCLKVTAGLHKKVVLDPAISVVHHRGFSRSKDTSSGLRRRHNNMFFNTIWGNRLRHDIRHDVLSRPGFWQGTRPTIAFAVTDTGDNTSAGEFYTASELGRALQKIAPVHVRYLDRSEWEDLSGIDILIVMVNRFDIRKAKNVNPFLISINWTRQWFDRWADDPTIQAYDFIWASSQRAANYLGEKIGRQVQVLPIASNSEVFASGTRREELVCDYCFTGSYFGVSREIQFQLDPTQVRGKGKVFGYNWEGMPFESISVGPIAYSRMPDVYASTRVVLDDANIATKPWGSCNSRVFDALAGGCLLITNGELGVRELFGDLVPSFNDAASLTETLNYWLDHEEERQERVLQLQTIVAEQHSYDVRARQVMGWLTQEEFPIRIAIKCAARISEKAQWGDYHFAESLAGSLREQGFVVRVDCREDWENGVSDTDDVVIVLRGLLPYRVKAHQKNILWLISHPTEVPQSEIANYNHIFVASHPHANRLSDVVDAPVEFLPQCTDTTRFNFLPEIVNTRADRALFVGNSRGYFRESVRWSVEQNLDIEVHGVGWEPFLRDNRLKGQTIPNSTLGEFYASSRLVLCDHWDDMKRLGYVSNRVFDVLAVGGRLAVDNVEGLAELIPAGWYEVFTNADELREIVQKPLQTNTGHRREIAKWVADNHSFRARAKRIGAVVRSLVGAS